MSSKSTRSSSCTRHGARVVVQTPINAKLQGEFEESEGLFDYSTSIDFNIRRFKY
jgi:hypothetical protein